MPKGMILAAGRGTRLGVLTAHRPKPLVPVANRPVMEQGIRSMQRAGITEICANASYYPEQLLATFGDGAALGVQLTWRVEDNPSGTAGGLKGLQAHLADDLVVVIAGDAMLDVDLCPLIAAHRAAGAFASLACIAVADPSQYGVVVTESDGRLRAFQEKPPPGTEISRQANTGIYVFDPAIFDLIPAGEVCDFALHIFPEILRRGLPFYAFPVQGYWTDIGNPGDYLQANLDYLAGRIAIEGYGERIGGNLIAPGAVTTGATLEECVIGAEVWIAPGSHLTRCVVWPGVTLDAPVALTGAVLTPHATCTLTGKTASLLAPTRVG